MSFFVARALFGEVAVMLISDVWYYLVKLQ